MDERKIEFLTIGGIVLLAGFAMGCAVAAPSPVAVVTAPIGSARLSRPVRLASQATFVPNQSSPLIPTGTRVDLLQAINAFEGAAQLYRIRTPDGQVGFATILPAEITA